MTLADAPDILIIGTLTPSVGGIATMIQSQVDYLHTAGVSAVVLNTGIARRRAPGRATLGNLASAVHDARRVRRHLRRARPALAAIHTTGSPSGPLLRCILLAAATAAAGVPTAVHFHSFDLVQTGRQTVAYRLLLRLLARLVARVVVLDDDTGRTITRLAPSARIAVIPNGVDTDFFAPSDPRRQANSGLHIVFVGTVGHRKGVDTLLQALSRLDPGFECTVVGGPAEEGREAFDFVTRPAREGPLVGHVQLIGELDRTTLADTLRESDLFVLPSRAEGMPVALLEAMSSGLPSVVSAAGQMPSMVAPDCGLVVAPDNPQELAAAMQSLMKSPGRLHAMGRAARIKATGTYAIAGTCAHLLHEYEEVVGKPWTIQSARGQTPLVTIVITCYNYGRFLQEAIDSCLAQTYPNVEIVVIDDGSNDNSADVARSYGNKIRYYFQNNAGPAAARNAGAACVRGQYVAFLDADDYLAPEFVEMTADPFLRHHDAELAFTYPQYRKFGEVNEVSAYAPFRVGAMLTTNIHATSLFRADLVRRYEYGKGWRRNFEDWDFHLTLLSRGYRGALVDAHLLNYRQHSAQSRYSEISARSRRLLFVRLMVRHWPLYVSHAPSLITAASTRLGRSGLRPWKRWE